MLYAALVFMVMILTALFGFIGISVAAAGVARILFYITLVLFAISLIAGMNRRTDP